MQLLNKLVFPLLGLAFLSACSTVPEVLKKTPVEPLTLAQVQAQPQEYQGRKVRWGGRILEVSNKENVTWMQVLATPLDRSQRPAQNADGIGRFLVRTSQFLDPAIYEAKREVTVIGTIDGTRERFIDKRKVPLVVLDAEVIYLWAKRSEYKTLYYPPYWGYYPYWSPYYYPWPYYY